jgi:hypothetical protein
MEFLKKENDVYRNFNDRTGNNESS